MKFRKEGAYPVGMYGFVSRITHLFTFTALFGGVLCGTCGAETEMQGGTFVLNGARTGAYFDHSSTGTVNFQLGPGASSATQTLVLQQATIDRGEFATTSTLYDATTTFSITLPLQEMPAGIHYLVARLPESGQIRWCHFIRLQPDGLLASPVPDHTPSYYRDLVLNKMHLFWDEETSGTWMGSDPHNDYHWVREDLYYAIALLARGTPADLNRANATLRALARAQDRDTLSSTYGIMLTNGHTRQVPDGAVTHFIPPVFAWLLLNPPPGLEQETKDEMRACLEAVCEYQVTGMGYSPIFQNFYLLGTATLALGGKVLDRPDLVELARTRMQNAYSVDIGAGGPPESNSPVYGGVNQWALKLVIEDADDTRTVAQARLISERGWLDTALFFHPGQLHSAGPYSRTYEDSLRGSTGLTYLMLARELGVAGLSPPGRVAEMLEAKHTHDLNPAYFEQILLPNSSMETKQIMLGRPLPDFVRQRFNHGEFSSWLSQNFTLGAATQSYATLRNEPFVLQVFDAAAPSGLSVSFARGGASDAGPTGYSSGTELGHFGLQHQGEVLYFVDYNFAPDQPPARTAFFSLVSDERFSEWQDFRRNAIPADPPFSLSAGDVITARRGAVYLLVRPLYAQSLGERSALGSVRRTNDHLGISVFAAESSAPISLANKRLEAGFAVGCYEEENWPSYEAFVSDHAALTSASMQEFATTRSLNWQGQHALQAVYDRGARTFASRKVNGSELPDVFLSSNAAAQTSTSGSLQVRDLAVSGLPMLGWVTYPVNSSTALVANPSASSIQLQTNWLSEPVTVGPYDLVRLQRPGESGIIDWAIYQD